MIRPYTKFEVSKFTHYEDMKGNAKCRIWGGFQVMGHPRSLAMSPFDSAHMISYSTLVETTRLSVPFSSYSELFVIWRSRWGRHRSNFAETFGVRKPEFSAIVWRCLRDSTFNNFKTITTCDGRTDRQTDRPTDTRYASIASRE